MSQQQWTRVDSYIDRKIVGADTALDEALAHNRAAGLPEIDVSPSQGKFLHLLARMAGSRTILEIGTLGGYSTIWLARALPPGGRLVTLERSAHHAAVATANLARAGLADRVDIRVGAALDTLPRLEAERLGPFDFVFIDADKPSNPDYFAWALKLSRPGTVILCDNVVRAGAVTDAASSDPNVRGVRALFDAIAGDARVSATALQTVGGKGWDGFVLALVQ